MGDDEISPEKIAEAVGAAAKVQSHLEKDVTDRCGYCGQHFGPDDIVVNKEFYGRKWVFCSPDCVDDFRESSDFKDQDLDSDPEISVHISKED